MMGERQVQQDALLLNVREAFTSEPSRPLIQRSRRLFSGLARFVSTYFFLKPSFMGMGVDIGKILEAYQTEERKNRARDALKLALTIAVRCGRWTAGIGATSSLPGASAKVPSPNPQRRP